MDDPSSKLQKLRTEKDEELRLRQHPTSLNPDEESLRRLKEGRQLSQPQPRLAPQVEGEPSGVGREGEQRAATERQGEDGPSGRGAVHERPQYVRPFGGQDGPGSSSGSDEELVEGPDPYAGMTARERKLHEVQQKLQQCRKANQNAVIAEKKRKQANAGNPEVVEGGDAPPDATPGARKKWYEERQRKQEAALAALGLDKSQAHRLETVEQAEAQYRKREKKGAPEGWSAFNQKTLYDAYLKRAENIPYSVEDYEATKARDPDFYRSADSLEYGRAPKLPEGNVDKMVNELNERVMKKKQFSRRRAHRDGKDIDFINDRNAHFNKKIERAFGKYTQEIKANLERGTALPD